VSAINLSDMIRDSFKRGVTIRRFPGGERHMIHRWRKDQMKGVTKTLGDLAAENVIRNNSLLRSLLGKKP
jgi:hypothetical protein